MMANILVVYYSKGGNTRKMAELVAEGAGGQGEHRVQLIPVQNLDSIDFLAADGFALGSPDYFTYVAGQMKVLFDEALASKAQLKDKPFVAFLSHGGGGGGIKSLETLAQAIGLKKVAESVVCKGAPEGKCAQDCRKLGQALAQALS